MRSHLKAWQEKRKLYAARRWSRMGNQAFCAYLTGPLGPHPQEDCEPPLKVWHLCLDQRLRHLKGLRIHPMHRLHLSKAHAHSSSSVGFKGPRAMLVSHGCEVWGSLCSGSSQPGLKARQSVCSSKQLHHSGRNLADSLHLASLQHCRDSRGPQIGCEAQSGETDLLPAGRVPRMSEPLRKPACIREDFTGCAVGTKDGLAWRWGHASLESICVVDFVQI